MPCPSKRLVLAPIQSPALFIYPIGSTIPRGPDTADPTMGWGAALAALGHKADAVIDQVVLQVVSDQVDAGIDVPTEGEVPRENYIHYHLQKAALKKKMKSVTLS